MLLPKINLGTNHMKKMLKYIYMCNMWVHYNIFITAKNYK